MYEDHFGLSERPFSIAPDPQYLYMSAQHKEAMAHLSYGVSQGGGFILLTGEVGTGKTTLCRNLLKRLPDDVDAAMILNANIQKDELLQTICDELGIAYKKRDSQKTLLNLLNKHLLDSFANNRKTVLIIDEAQLLSRDVLEQIRLLTNLETTKTKLLQIILIGQPELSDVLRREDLRQLAQRVTARYHLNSIRREDMTEYVTYRLKVAGCVQALFTKQALSKIYRLTKGIPRLINVLCDHSLLVAYAKSARLVDTDVVKQAAQEMMLSERQPLRVGALASSWFKPAVLTAGAVCLAGLLWMFYPNMGFQNSSADTVAGAFKLDAEEKPTASQLDENSSENDADGSNIASVSGLDTRGDETDHDLDISSISLDEDQSIAPEVENSIKQPQLNGELESANVSAVEKNAAIENVVEGDDVVLDAGKPMAQNALSVLLSSATAETSRVQAFRNLAEIWQRPLPPQLLSNLCDEVAGLGLSCLYGESTLAIISQYNRPVILVLENDTGLHRVILKDIDAATALLQIGQQDYRVPINELESLWTQRYLLYWQAPAIKRRLLIEGMQGPEVVWLRQQIHFALLRNDRPGIADTVKPWYDSNLKQTVTQLQERSGLPVDGQVGILTFMLLNEMLRGDKIPDLPSLVRNADQLGSESLTAKPQ